MKKTLIALAAVAVSTGAMAQATISGSTNFDFTKEENAVGTYKFSDFDVTFGASEDLGGGLTASASATMNFEAGRQTDGGTNEGNVAVENVFIRFSSADLGTLTLGRLENGNGIIGRGAAGAADFTFGADNGTVLTEAGNNGNIGYNSPRISGFQIGASYTNGADEFAKSDPITAGVNYSAGAISAAIDYNLRSERVRMSASYDLGVAKLGAGYEIKGTSAGNHDSFVIGATAPMGPVTLGVSYAAKTNAPNEDAALVDFGAAYALSNRTSVSTAYQHSMDGGNAADAYQFRVRLTHSF